MESDHIDIEEEDEEKAASELISIVNEFLVHGNANEPKLVNRLEAFIKKDGGKKPLILRPNKASFSPRVQDKQRKKQQCKKHTNDTSSSSYEDDFMPARRKSPEELLPNPVVKSSEPYYPLPSDTPIYDTEIDDTLADDDELCDEALMLKMKSLCLANQEKELNARKQEALKEIEEELRGLPQLRERILNHSWRSFFIHSNTSDDVSEQDLENLLQTIYMNL